jgi:hypothetical protein
VLAGAQRSRAIALGEFRRSRLLELGRRTSARHERRCRPTYYIQTINTSLGVYRKSDGVRVAAFTFDTLVSRATLIA